MSTKIKLEKKEYSELIKKTSLDSSLFDQEKPVISGQTDILTGYGNEPEEGEVVIVSYHHTFLNFFSLIPDTGLGASLTIDGAVRLEEGQLYVSMSYLAGNSSVSVSGSADLYIDGNKVSEQLFTIPSNGYVGNPLYSFVGDTLFQNVSPTGHVSVLLHVSGTYPSASGNIATNNSYLVNVR